MKSVTITFNNKATEYRINVVLPETLSEAEQLLGESEAVKALEGYMIAEAKLAAIGRKRRTKRFIRVDLDDPRLAQCKSLVATCALESLRSKSKISPQLDGVTTATEPPAIAILESTNS